MNKVLIWTLMVVILILIAITIVIMFRNQKLMMELAKNSRSPQTSSISQTNSPGTNPSQSPSKKPTLIDTQNQIIASLNSANYQPLLTFLNESISLTLMSTECCGTTDKNEAIDQMSYISSGKPFTFEQSSQTITNLKAKNAQLANKFIGISQNGEHLAAFKIDATNKISEIDLAVSYKLYNQ